MQLAISSAFSILAMAAFAMNSPSADGANLRIAGAGNLAQASALTMPTELRLLPGQR